MYKKIYVISGNLQKQSSNLLIFNLMEFRKEVNSKIISIIDSLILDQENANLHLFAYAHTATHIHFPQ